MALSAVRANQILDAIHGVAALVSVTSNTLRTRLMTANGTATTNGTELATSGGYTSGTGAPLVTFGAAASQSSANTTAVTVTNMPATTIVGVENWGDVSGTPQRQEFGALTTSRTTNAGDTFSIAISAMTSALT